ncbi:MAG: DegT/DnrJ/EryC1/StrS family aminotransferase [bacterium]|nr:DegT/DnrJ/EryC1/StrS family aminotransferase [bacterium]
MISHSRPTIDDSDVKAVIETIKSGYIAQGNKVRELELEFSSYIGMQPGVATSSGTAALHLALIALEINDGDEVILPTYVCTAPLNTIYYVGAKPVLVDIDEDTFNLKVSDVRKKLTKKTKVIIVPHMFGQPANIDELLKIGLPIIEDCAHSVGAHYKGKKTGSFGIISVFSFYATKVITGGEGGMVLSTESKLLSKIKDLRDYDAKDDFKVRFNYKMTDVEASLILSQLAKLPFFIARRKKIAGMYNASLSDCNFTLPVSCVDREHIFYRYVVKIKSDVRVYLEALKRKGVMCDIPVYRPLHRYLGLTGFDSADQVYQSAISIPIYPSLQTREIDSIIKALQRVNERLS